MSRIAWRSALAVTILGLLWVSLCMLFVVFTLGIGLLIAWIPLGIVAVWFIYRVARGWLALNDGRPMPLA